MAGRDPPFSFAKLHQQIATSGRKFFLWLARTTPDRHRRLRAASPPARCHQRSEKIAYPQISQIFADSKQKQKAVVGQALRLPILITKAAGDAPAIQMHREKNRQA